MVSSSEAAHKTVGWRYESGYDFTAIADKILLFQNINWESKTAKKDGGGKLW